MIYLVFDGSYDRNILYATEDKNDALIFMRNFVRKFPNKWDKPVIKVFKKTSLKVMLEMIDNAADEWDVSNYVEQFEEE